MTPQELPAVLASPDGVTDLCAWAAAQRPAIAAALDRAGAVLFRGFGVSSAEQLQQFVSATSGDLLPYRERSSPREQVTGHIYTSTSHPADAEIYLHNEQSYAREFPLKIYFGCLHPAEAGGETPLADCRRVFARLSERTRASFDDGYRYVRNFGGAIGMSWQEAFQTADRAQVETYCASHDIACRWSDGDRLTTTQVRRAFARHPRTGEWVWFNHLTFFHVSTLPADVQDVLMSDFADQLPNQTYHADGREIAPGVLDELRAAYASELRAFAWERGDVLMVDNMLAAHGRRPFRGERRVVVGMAEPCAWDQV